MLRSLSQRARAASLASASLATLVVASASALSAGCSSSSPELAFAVRTSAAGEASLASMDDLETARLATVAHLSRLEELVRVAPSERAVRARLVVGWARYALLFVEDDLEEARDRGDAPGAAYHAVRAHNAYERAIHHGREYLDGGAFEAAVSGDRVPAFLAERTDDPTVLLWLGGAWLGRQRVATENHRQLAAQARAGEALLTHAASRGDTRQAGWAHLHLALGQIRTGGDPDRAFSHLAEAARRQPGLLLRTLYQARACACLARESDRREPLLREVLDARDPDPEVRIDNAVAKRKAARDLPGPRRAQCVP